MADHPPRSSRDPAARKALAAQAAAGNDPRRSSREIAPKLDAFSLKEIAKATGLSLAACSRIRAGAKVPHPRHWDALLTLVGGR